MEFLDLVSLVGLPSILEGVVLSLHCLQLQSQWGSVWHAMELADGQKLFLLRRYLCLSLTCLCCDLQRRERAYRSMTSSLLE